MKLKNLVLVMVVLIMLVGCSNSSEVRYVCIFEGDRQSADVILEGKEDTLVTMTSNFTDDLTKYEFVDDEDYENYKKAIISLYSAYDIKGIDFTYEFSEDNKKLTNKMIIDLSSITDENLELINFNFLDKPYNISKTIEYFENNGFNCELN